MRTLKELSDDLKEYIIALQQDAHNRSNFRPERYNNLKLSMDLTQNDKAHVIVTLTLSKAEFDLKTLDKNSGGLGPDERLVLKWLNKPNIVPELLDCWRRVQRNRGKAYEKYKV